MDPAVLVRQPVVDLIAARVVETRQCDR